MPRKQVLYPGDTVRIVNPKFVKRVGYSLVWTDLVEHIRNTHEKNTGLLLRSKLHQSMSLLNLDPRDPRQLKEFINGVAATEVVKRKFGGNERSLVYWDSMVGESRHRQEHVIKSKRCVQTGKYNSCCFEPRLDHAKTHVLLTLDCGEIEECNVELVRRKGK